MVTTACLLGAIVSSRGEMLDDMGKHVRFTYDECVCLSVDQDVAAETRKYSTVHASDGDSPARDASPYFLSWAGTFRAADDAIISLIDAKGKKGKGEIGNQCTHSEMGGRCMRMRPRQARIAGLVSRSHVESSNWCVSVRDGHAV